LQIHNIFCTAMLGAIHCCAGWLVLDEVIVPFTKL
jgi:hypothetical protein